jgi:hypothetical protein
MQNADPSRLATYPHQDQHRSVHRTGRARGCVGAWLDTFSFQARGFYERLGYSLAGTIPDHPLGEARYFMIKRWDAPA